MGRNWAAAGWILFLIGGYLYFPFYLGVPSVVNYLVGVPSATAGHIGLYMITAGIPLAVALSVYRHGIAGLHEVMNVIQVFADTMSYLRLYALGLAGGIVAATMNGLAGGLPWFFGVLLLILAHGINMALGIMSGVIHGLRLNFLEWYHYSFEGGGKKFKALRMLNLE
jgi:V/A-type H+-transporting ATPase subunit I